MDAFFIWEGKENVKYQEFCRSHLFLSEKVIEYRSRLKPCTSAGKIWYNVINYELEECSCFQKKLEST